MSGPSTAACRRAGADIADRRHAIVETVFADLIEGPLAHILRAFRRQFSLTAVHGGRPQPAARGRCARRRVLTALPAAPPCGGASSPSLRGWPDLNAARSCTYRRTGHGHNTGAPGGTTSSALVAHQPKGPKPPTGKAGQTSRYPLLTARNQDHTPTAPHHGSRSVGRG